MSILSSRKMVMLTHALVSSSRLVRASASSPLAASRLASSASAAATTTTDAGGAQGQQAARSIRWGICGTGTIASDMVQVLRQLPGTEVRAVGSRSAEGAAKFADKWCPVGPSGGPVARCASYEELAARDDLDVVYVATPSARHVDDW